MASHFFEVLYGHSPGQFGISATDTCVVPDLDTWLKDCALMLRILQQHLERVRTRMKNQADKKHSDCVFNIGDSVSMEVQPYIQLSVAPLVHHKLLFKYYGSFEVRSDRTHRSIGLSASVTCRQPHPPGAACVPA